MASDADKTRKEFPLILRTDVGGIEEISLAKYFIARESIDSVNRGVRKRLIIRALTLYLAAVEQEKIIDPEARIDLLADDYRSMLGKSDANVRIPSEQPQTHGNNSRPEQSSKRVANETVEAPKPSAVRKPNANPAPTLKAEVPPLAAAPAKEIPRQEEQRQAFDDPDDIRSRRIRMARESGL